MTEDKFYEKLCAEVRRKRKERGYNQQDMADFIGLTRPAYVNLENNKNNTTVYKMLLICQLLEIEIPVFAASFMNAKIRECFSNSRMRKEKKKKRLKETIEQARRKLAQL